MFLVPFFAYTTFIRLFPSMRSQIECIISATFKRFTTHCTFIFVISDTSVSFHIASEVVYAIKNFFTKLTFDFSASVSASLSPILKRRSIKLGAARRIDMSFLGTHYDCFYIFRL